MATLEPANPRLFESVEPVIGMDRLLVGVWEALTFGESVGCPVCGAEMRPQSLAHAGACGGHCEECGATLT